MCYTSTMQKLLETVRHITKPRKEQVMEIGSLIASAIALVGTVIGGLLVYRKEHEKVQAERESELNRMNQELYSELSKQTEAINTRVKNELESLSDKNEELLGDMEAFNKELALLKLNFISISRQYAIMRARVTELSKIAKQLIEQIEDDGSTPVFSQDAVEELVAVAGDAQDEICVACLTNILAGGKMSEDEIRDAIISTTPKETI